MNRLCAILLLACCLGAGEGAEVLRDLEAFRQIMLRFGAEPATFGEAWPRAGSTLAGDPPAPVRQHISELCRMLAPCDAAIQTLVRPDPTEDGETHANLVRLLGEATRLWTGHVHSLLGRAGPGPQSSLELQPWHNRAARLELLLRLAHASRETGNRRLVVVLGKEALRHPEVQTFCAVRDAYLTAWWRWLLEPDSDAAPPFMVYGLDLRLLQPSVRAEADYMRFLPDEHPLRPILSDQIATFWRAKLALWAGSGRWPPGREPPVVPQPPPAHEGSLRFKLLEHVRRVLAQRRRVGEVEAGPWEAHPIMQRQRQAERETWESLLATLVRLAQLPVQDEQAWLELLDPYLSAAASYSITLQMADWHRLLARTLIGLPLERQAGGEAQAAPFLARHRQLLEQVARDEATTLRHFYAPRPMAAAAPPEQPFDAQYAEEAARRKMLNAIDAADELHRRSRGQPPDHR